MCENLHKIALCALILQKWHPKSKCFFGGHYFFVFFGQVRGNLAQAWGKFGQKLCLKCFDLKKCGQNEMQSFFWRSFSVEFFSGKYGEIWAKILRTPKNLPSPTPMILMLRRMNSALVRIELDLIKCNFRLQSLV